MFVVVRVEEWNYVELSNFVIWVVWTCLIASVENGMHQHQWYVCFSSETRRFMERFGMKCCIFWFQQRIESNIWNLQNHLGGWTKFECFHCLKLSKEKDGDNPKLYGWGASFYSIHGRCELGSVVILITWNKSTGKWCDSIYLLLMVQKFGEKTTCDV